MSKKLIKYEILYRKKNIGIVCSGKTCKSLNLVEMAQSFLVSMKEGLLRSPEERDAVWGSLTHMYQQFLVAVALILIEFL